jgi:hypothetical protein
MASSGQPFLVAAEQIRGTVDQLTAYFILERQLAHSGSCSLTVPVFDGSGLYNLRPSYAPAATPAASNNRLASRASTALRSEGLILRSLTESSAMLSWRGTVDDWAGAGRFRILFSLDGSVIVPEASSETALAEQMMKLEQRRYCHTRRVDRCIPAQATGSSIHAAIAVTSPGIAST